MVDAHSNRTDFTTAGAYVESFKENLEMDDSDDEVDSQIQSFNRKSLNDQWANFDAEPPKKKHGSRDQEYSESSFD